MPERGPRDTRMGAGALFQAIEMPTLLVPVGCECSWTVIRPGPGLASVSQLKYRHAGCRQRHDLPRPGGGRLSA